MTHDNQKKKQRIPLSRLLILAAACGIFAYSAIQLWTFFSENRENEAQQQELIDQAVVVIAPDTQTEPAPSDAESEETAPRDSTQPSEAPVETAPIYVDFAVLQEQNPEIIGWIYCEDTKINYPIVRGEDNQYYLKRSHTGEYNSNGSIFMDFRNLADFSDFNNLIYGHNMRNEVMFGSLKRYTEQSYYEEHPVMWILTPDKAFRVDLIAGMVTPSDSDTYEIFSYAEDLHERLEYALSQSTFDAGEVDISQIQHVVTLSTCSYEYATARYVVIGSLVEVDYPQPPETE